MTTQNQTHCTRRIHVAVMALMAAAICISASTVVAGPFTLTDGNSKAKGDTSTFGLLDWKVDGIDQLEQQWFWYRVKSYKPENIVSTEYAPLTIEVEQLTNTDLDPGNDTLFVRYGNEAYAIEIRLSLEGGAPGSGASNLGELITIVNRSYKPLEFHFFQYTDFEVNGTADFDEVYFASDNSVRQYEGNIQLTETVVTPVPSHREAAAFSTIRDKLNDAFPTTLNDTPAQNVVLGPGDMTWAYQWDFVIPKGGSVQISKVKNLQAVPEPSTAVLALIAICPLAWVWQRRRNG